MEPIVKSRWTNLTIQDDRGIISFRRGTGDNVEITMFKATTPRQGNGKSLLASMLRKLIDYPPYHAVYGFTRTYNFDAIKAYEALGFVTSPVTGVYKDGHAVVFSATYTVLCARHLGGDDA